MALIRPMALNHIANAILLLVHMVSLIGVVQRIDAESINSSLYLLVLLPHPNSQGNPSWSGGLNVLPGVRLAVEDVQSSGILSGHSLKLLERDGGCNYTNRARISFLDSVFYSEKQIVGLIGPGCSASAVAIAPLITGQDVSLLSIHGAGTPQLENHSKYPNSFGIFGSSHGLVDTIIALMQLSDWKKVGVLYDSSRVFQSTTHDALISRACNDTFCFNISSAALTDYDFHLDQIKKKTVRIVFLLAGPALARNLLCTAFHMDMTYPSIQWVIVERLLIELDEDVTVHYQEKTYSCSREIMTNRVLNGSVFITYRLANFDENARTYANISYTQFFESYTSRIETINSANPNSHTLKPSPWGSMFYDAVWAIAIALSEARKSSTFNINEYGSETRRVNDTLVLQQEIHKLNFTGVSGQVRFNAATGYNERAFDISIVVNGTAKLIACYTSGSGFEHTMTNDSDGVNYYLKDEFPEEVREIPLHATISIGLFTTLIFCLTVFFHILTVYYRNDYFVRAASMKLSQMAYIGCYLLLFTSFTYVMTEGIDLDNTTRAALCHLTYIFCSIGFTFLFGTLCAKEWRLYRISNHYLKPGKCLSDRPLFVLILLATTGDIFINILWISLDRFEIDFSYETNFDDAKRIITKHCHAKYLLGWYLAIYVYNLIFLLLACLLAVVAQKIYIVGFQTKVVFKMTYFTLLLMGIMISIQIIFITNEHLERLTIFIFDSIILNVAVLLANLFLFFPPVYPSIYKRPRNKMSIGITLTKHTLVY